MEKIKEGDQVTCADKGILGDYVDNVAIVDRITPSEILLEGIAIIQFPDKRKFKVPVKKLTKYHQSSRFDEATLTREDFRRVLKANTTPWQYRKHLHMFRMIESDIFGVADDEY